MKNVITSLIAASALAAGIIATAQDAAAPKAETSAEAAKPNTLSESEQKAGWQLHFNGTDLTGWSNFKSDKVRKGWQVIDGNLVCADPHDAGDLCTKGEYDWFELQLDFKMGEGANSGVIYHASKAGGAVWATGPELQLEDNAKATDPQRCGWLYGLYKPENDPKTNKPVDATKPAGEWNHLRLVLTPEKCVHEINGVKYFEYVLDSDDFKKRVAASKFGAMKDFAKVHKGYLCLQGDHGKVTFRNVKLLPLAKK